MKPNKQITKSNKETKKLAYDIASQFKGGEILALVGDLGAGKTTFTQGLAEYFGVAEYVSSPTFTLINEYVIKKSKKLNNKITKLIHIDAYRLEDSQEIINLGIEDYLNCDSVVVIIEWAEQVRSVLPKKTKWIYFKHGKEENERRISIK